MHTTRKSCNNLHACCLRNTVFHLWRELQVKEIVLICSYKHHLRRCSPEPGAKACFFAFWYEILHLHHSVLGLNKQTCAFWKTVWWICSCFYRSMIEAYGTLELYCQWQTRKHLLSCWGLNKIAFVDKLTQICRRRMKLHSASGNIMHQKVTQPQHSCSWNHHPLRFIPLQSWYKTTQISAELKSGTFQISFSSNRHV